MGAIYYLDLTTNTTTELLAPGSAVRNDGLAIGLDADHGAVLYVVENGNYRISAWSLEAWRTESPGAVVDIVPLGYILLNEQDDPSTCDVLGGSIYCVNARFNSVEFPSLAEDDVDTFSETFSIIGTDRFAFVKPGYQAAELQQVERLVDDMEEIEVEDLSIEDSFSGNRNSGESEENIHAADKSGAVSPKPSSWIILSHGVVMFSIKIILVALTSY